MPKLTDLQAILLSCAAQRDDASLYPLPHCASDPIVTTRAITALVKRGFAQERETSAHGAICRTDGDITYGLYITPTGLAAIGVEPDGGGEGAGNAPTPDGPPPPRQTKTDAVLALLRRDDGATLADLIAVTDWLPHTTRAALTGLRKKGHDIARTTRDGVSVYRIKVAVDA